MQNLLKSGYVGLVNFKSKIHYNLRHVLKTFTLNGVKLYIDDPILSKDVFLSLLQGGYEDKEAKIIKEKLKPEDTVLELGAGLGFNSIIAAKINGGKITAYEANPSLIPLIKKNQHLNRITFEVRNKILVNDNSSGKTVPFNIGANVNMSSVKNYKENSIIEVKQIETEFLPDVLTKLSPGFFIVDIEGGELDLFSIPDMLRNSSVKKILVELHPWVIGDDACTSVIKNILAAGFKMETEWCIDSVFYFSR